MKRVKVLMKRGSIPETMDAAALGLLLAARAADTAREYAFIFDQLGITQ